MKWFCNKKKIKYRQISNHLKRFFFLTNLNKKKILRKIVAFKIEIKIGFSCTLLILMQTCKLLLNKKMIQIK